MKRVFKIDKETLKVNFKELFFLDNKLIILNISLVSILLNKSLKSIVLFREGLTKIAIAFWDRLAEIAISF